MDDKKDLKPETEEEDAIAEEEALTPNKTAEEEAEDTAEESKDDSEEENNGENVEKTEEKSASRPKKKAPFIVAAVAMLTVAIAVVISVVLSSPKTVFEKAVGFIEDGEYARVLDYTSKTQFLFRIEKGILDVNDSGVNEYIPPEDLRVPFRNMVYIGDSETDIPCMKLVNTYGGHSIGVYDPERQDKTKVFQMMEDRRIRYFVPADYTEGSELDTLIKAIIQKTAVYEILEDKHNQDMAETRSAAGVR
jgi:hypothetical protein